MTLELTLSNSHIQHIVHYTIHDFIRYLFARELQHTKNWAIPCNHSTHSHSRHLRWCVFLSSSLYSNGNMFKFDAHINTLLLCTMTATIYGYDMQFSNCILTKIPRGVHFPNPFEQDSKCNVNVKICLHSRLWIVQQGDFNCEKSTFKFEN